MELRRSSLIVRLSLEALCIPRRVRRVRGKEEVRTITAMMKVVMVSGAMRKMIRSMSVTRK